MPRMKADNRTGILRAAEKTAHFYWFLWPAVCALGRGGNGREVLFEVAQQETV
jgi:hypothetical protein